MRIKGFATREGTERFKRRFEEKAAPGHFREGHGLWFSSIGAGSYLGESDEETDRLYEEGLKEAIRLGVNVVDSAINYRCQRSERSFGKALAALIEAGEIQRDEILLCTKGGFIPFDGEYPPDPSEYFRKTYLDPGILKHEDIVQGCHAMTPHYLEDQLARSLVNWGVETLDLYYLHNPETQLAEVSPQEFANRLRTAFQFLEKKVSEGKIRMYGMATWSGFRNAPENRDHLSLEDICILAREAGGGGHHLKVVQLPINLVMPEAWVLLNQKYGADSVSFLALARRLGILAVSSGSLSQGRLAGALPSELKNRFPSLKASSQCALQFARSCPGVMTALAGMKQVEHVRENLETAKTNPLSEAELLGLFQPSD